MKKISNRDLNQLAQLNTVKSNPPSDAPLLAIDYGEKFCGLAWSPDGIVVFPVAVISHQRLLIEVEKYLKKKNIQTIILGLPLGSRNEENDICGQIRVFASTLQNDNRKIYFQNERFSSQAVLGSADRIDDLAAAKILEYWLEKK